MDTKQRILLEALRLFSKRGYDAVSVEQIASAVGIKAPSLYKHYKSKKDVFDAIFEDTAKRYEEFIQTISIFANKIAPNPAIEARADIIEWRYKLENGRVYKRRYN